MGIEIPNTTPLNIMAVLTEISRILASKSEIKHAFDECVPLLRRVFLFDHIAVFSSKGSADQPDVVFARAVGRGRSKEAEITWGSILAGQVMSANVSLTTQPEMLDSKDRNHNPYQLGLPIRIKGEIIGCCVFIRFGGPEFSLYCLQTAEMFISLTSLFLERNQSEQQMLALGETTLRDDLQDQFLSYLMHELRTPLGFIKGFATTLLRSDTAWEQNSQIDFLQIIDRETDRMLELINNYLDSARFHAGRIEMNTENLQLEKFINDIILKTKIHYPGLEIHLRVSGSIPSIQADAKRLAQVFDNLISNSVKYAPSSPIQIKFKNEGKKIQILFSDSGKGIPRHFLPMVFNRFFRVPGDAPGIHGTGLGLFICRQIIEAHHGTISVESKPDVQTTFIITFPVEGGQ